MPRLKILSGSEQDEFDHPPVLSGEGRKIHFRLNKLLRELITPIKGDMHQIGFVLMLYYFKTVQKFFIPQTFRSQDIEYVSRQLKIDHFKASDFQLDKYSFRRYKAKILQHYGCSPFDSAAKILLNQKIYQLASSHVKPKVIFNDCVDLLLIQKIEVPKYNTLCIVILNNIKEYTISILQSLTNSLSKEHILLLDDLLSFMEDKAVYKLTSLKSFNHAIRPKAIKANVDDLTNIQGIYNQLLPIVKTLPINVRGIEYFATTVLKSDIFRVQRKSCADKYLHLITFVVYQYSILHDALMDILLKSIASFNSSVKREHQHRCYKNRTKYAAAISDFQDKDLEQINMIKSIYFLCKNHQGDYQIKCDTIEHIIKTFFDNLSKPERNEESSVSESDYNDSGYYRIMCKASNLI